MPFSNANPPDPEALLEGVRLVPLEESDLDQLLAIESDSFASPWKREHFLFEMHENRFSVSTVARAGDTVMGYVCVWRVEQELKINNFAVRTDCRRRGLGRWMLQRTLNDARAAGCTQAILEVRPSNSAALGLYGEFGFVEIGRRKGYYQQEGEDAIVLQAPLV